MANFKITQKTTVAKLKEQFRNQVGGTLRIYDGRSEAAENVTLVSIGAKVGEWDYDVALKDAQKVRMSQFNNAFHRVTSPAL